MKKILFILVIFLSSYLISMAAQPLRIVWEAGDIDETHPAPTGYKIYYSDNPSQLNKYSIDVGNVLEYYIAPLPLSFGVTYSFYVTAYNETVESGPSNIIYFTWPSIPLLIF